jgi:hypothetical protein
MALSRFRSKSVDSTRGFQLAGRSPGLCIGIDRNVSYPPLIR